MNSDIKQRWIAALRSGQYPQGDGYLYRIHEKTFCCLGVLCELYRLETPGVEWRVGNTFSKGYGIDYESRELPAATARWAGIDRSYANEIEKLMIMNDHGIEFGAIADYIEANL